MWNRWHVNINIHNNTVELHTYLGLTQSDYRKWAGKEDKLENITYKYISDRLKLNKFLGLLSNFSSFELINKNIKSNSFYVECDELFNDTIFLYTKYDHVKELDTEYYIVSPFSKDILLDKRDLIDIYESTLEVISFQYSKKMGVYNIKIINILDNFYILNKIKLM